MVKAGKGRSRNAWEEERQEDASWAGQSSSENSKPRIDPRVQREIGKHLRAHYDDMINEPVPDKFIELLEQLERSVTRKS